MTLFRQLITIVLFVNIINANQGDSDQVLCAFTGNNVNVKDKKIHINTLNGTISQKGKSTADAGRLINETTQECIATVPYCFTLWLTDSTGQSQATLLRGCWSHSDKEECSNSQCIANSAPSVSNLPNNTRFCCCYGNFCNENVTDNVGSVQVTTTVIAQVSGHGSEPIDYDPNYKNRTIVTALALVMFGAIVIIAIYVVAQCYHKNRHKTPEAVPLKESPSTPHWELDSLKLDILISGGRFSDVYTGTLNDEIVAVKLFTGHSQRQYYNNERAIYSLPFIEHSSVVKFYGTDEQISMEGHRRYMVVLEYITLGTLTHYLKLNTIDSAVLCKMCRSIAGGMSHLHGEIKRADKKKPAIAHRDLNSRNVLVRDDLGLVICDFGFAMQIEGSKIVKNGTEQEVEQSSLTDVGTRRYMAPEILEGAVNLRDCEASLKQIDVYAMGLLFWEVGTRCIDMYQGLPVPEYQLPFQAELGPHPSFEDMQLLVSKNKARPLFPNQWKDSHQAMRAFKETIEDCWDQDGEARLTALCVDERLVEIESFWARHKGMPAINTSNFELPPTSIPEKRPELCNLNVLNENDHTYLHPISPVSPGTTTLSVQEQNARNLVQGSGETGRNISELSQAGSSMRSVSNATDNSISSATTDTLLSPLENMRPPNVAYPPNSVYFTRLPKKPLYAHQGENPTLARNTHKASDEDFEVHGNALVDKTRVPSTTANRGGTHLDAIVDNLQRPLGENETIRSGQARRSQIRSNPHAIARIPFMQNDVASEPLIVRPKQPNVQAPQKKSLLQKLGLDKALFKRTPVNKSNTAHNLHTQAYSATAKQSPNIDTSHYFSVNQIGAGPGTYEDRDMKCNLVAAASQDAGTDTEVCIVDGEPVVRAALASNYTVDSHGDRCERTQDVAPVQLNDMSINGQIYDTHAVCVDFSSADCSLESATSHPSSRRSHNGYNDNTSTKSMSHSSTDLSPTSDESFASSATEFTEPKSKARRPDSLVLGSRKRNPSGGGASVAHAQKSTKRDNTTQLHNGA